eukprot:TRINITY_DN4419_c5_g1_i1.p1 TRINITY_DN4419_c5_g1~~TRINITY_DN4419_c5_g1_i1.p1  ORF type:complete len:831 (+),score=125.96 TRINITY_DN4419_c5_g1_i1:190-2493(+)
MNDGCWSEDSDPNPECFTVFIMTYKREPAAVAAASHYRFCNRVKEVRIVWSESPFPPKFQNGKGAKVVVDNHYPSQSLNIRFQPIKEVQTTAIFSVDDDVRITCADLEGAHDEWLKAPNKLVGFFPRTVEHDRIHGRWVYRGYPTVYLSGSYSIILSKAAFISLNTIKFYRGEGDRQNATRQLVDRNRNCEDLAIQFASNNLSEEAPLFYSPRDEVVDYGSWLFGLWMSGLSSRRAAGQHMLDRGRCITELTRIWLGRAASNGIQPLPATSQIAGTKSWTPSTGWEFISSDLWASLLVTSPSLLCLVLFFCLLYLLYLYNNRQTTKTVVSGPMLIFYNRARFIVILMFVCIMFVTFDCCHHKTQTIHPMRIPCQFESVNKTVERKVPKKVLKIAVCTGVYSGVVDGVSLTLNRMVAYFEEMGHQVIVLSPDQPVETGIPKYSGSVVRVNGISGWLLGRPEYYYATALGPTALSYLQNMKPDIIHIATPDGSANEAQQFAKEHNIPTLCSYHTRFNKYFSYYGFSALETVYWHSVKPFFDQCTYVLPPTSAVKNELLDHGIQSQIELWPRGVDTEVFNPRKKCGSFIENTAPGEITILLVCRLVLEKNLKLFVEIIKALTAEGVPHRSVVVGEGQARSWMQQQLPETRFVGKGSEELLAIAYASSDVFIYPSTTETWGNVILEAMSSGLPVIGANASGTTTLVQHERTGFIIDDDNPFSYVSRVKQLAMDPLLRGRLSKEARKVAETFTWDAAFTQLLNTYDEAISRR